MDKTKIYQENQTFEQKPPMSRNSSGLNLVNNTSKVS